MAISATASSLVRRMQEDTKEFDILGFVCWWSIREISLTRDQLMAALTNAGLSDKYAREHNYRAALARAINELEEESLVRKVREDNVETVFQFTDEKQVTTVGDTENQNTHLAYTPKVVVTVDKEAYSMFKDLNESIKSINDPTTGEPVADASTFKAKIVEAFNRHKSTYKSSDLTRYIQQIFRENADIISLREQGSVYFVPSEFKGIVESVSALFDNLLMPSGFQYMPVPDAASSRKLVADSFAMEAATLLDEIQNEVDKAGEAKKDLTESWLSSRMDRLSAIKSRISRYDEILGSRLVTINGKVDAVSQILKPRVLVLS